jgi:hypothetical protein
MFPPQTQAAGGLSRPRPFFQVWVRVFLELGSNTHDRHHDEANLFSNQHRWRDALRQGVFVDDKLAHGLDRTVRDLGVASMRSHRRGSGPGALDSPDAKKSFQPADIRWPPDSRLRDRATKCRNNVRTARS